MKFLELASSLLAFANAQVTPVNNTGNFFFLNGQSQIYQDIHGTPGTAQVGVNIGNYFLEEDINP